MFGDFGTVLMQLICITVNALCYKQGLTLFGFSVIHMENIIAAIGFLFWPDERRKGVRWLL